MEHLRPSLYMAVTEDVVDSHRLGSRISIRRPFSARLRTSKSAATRMAPGTTKVGIFRPPWRGCSRWILTAAGGYDPGVDRFGFFRTAGDVPIVGDWNGDGKGKIGIYRPSTGLFMPWTTTREPESSMRARIRSNTHLGLLRETHRSSAIGRAMEKPKWACSLGLMDPG